MFTSSAAARFLQYVTFDTQSDESSTTYPSTGKAARAVESARQGAAEHGGIADAAIDQHGYVMATIPASAGKAGVPGDRLHRARGHVAGGERART